MGEFEDYNYLDLVCAHLAKEKPRSSASGFCKFFRLRKYAPTDEEAETLLQRLYDAYMLTPEDPIKKRLVLTQASKVNLVQTKVPDVSLANDKGKEHYNFKPVDLKELEINDEVVKAPLNHEGRYAVCRMYAMLRPEIGLFYLFRSEDVLKLRAMIDLKDPDVAIFITEKKTRPLLEPKSPPAKVSYMTSSSREEVAKQREAQKNQKIPRRPLGYLYLQTRVKTWKFCLETDEDRSFWRKALEDLKIPAPKEAPDEDELNCLPLKDVLETPHFKRVFSEFLVEQFSIENLHFMEAVESYRLLTDNTERKEAAKKIYELFIEPKAAELVNLDSRTSADVVEKYKSNQFRKTLFDAAYEVIYRMVEVDVYVRFTRSARYKVMISTDRAISVPSSEKAKRESCFIPAIYDIKTLQKIQTEIMKSTLPKEHRKNLKKFTQCFTGKELVDWMLANHHARIRPAAVGACQRLADAGFLRHVEDAHPFKDGKKLFTCELSSAQKKMPTAAQFREQMKKEGRQIFEGTVLLHGMMAYSKVYIAIDPDRKRLYLYRSRFATTPPFRVVELKVLTKKLVATVRGDKTSGGNILGIDLGLVDPDDFSFSNSPPPTSTTSTTPTTTSGKHGLSIATPGPSSPTPTPTASNQGLSVSIPDDPSIPSLPTSSTFSNFRRVGSPTAASIPTSVTFNNVFQNPLPSTRPAGFSLAKSTSSTLLVTSPKSSSSAPPSPSRTPSGSTAGGNSLFGIKTRDTGLSISTTRTSPSPSVSSTTNKAGNSPSIDISLGSTDDTSSFVFYIEYGDEIRFRLQGETPYQYWTNALQIINSLPSASSDRKSVDEKKLHSSPTTEGEFKSPPITATTTTTTKATSNYALGAQTFPTSSSSATGFGSDSGYTPLSRSVSPSVEMFRGGGGGILGLSSRNNNTNTQVPVRAKSNSFSRRGSN